MKSIHFCESNQVEQIINGVNGDTIISYRTGWMPTYIKNEIIHLKLKNYEYQVWCACKVINYELVTYDSIPESNMEVKKYNRKFEPGYFFIKLTLKLIMKEVNK